LHQIRMEMEQPADDQPVAEAESDPLSGSIDDLRETVAKLHEKVDAMLIAMMQLKR
jgi:tetrahydromethanopterin S-methyltransferase subunit B